MSRCVSHRGLAGIVLLIALVWPCTDARALDPHRAVTQYGHTSWTSQRGLPGEAVYEIVQTADGYLWLRTSAGLVRFDGVRFARVDPVVDGDPVRDPTRAICRGADGTLIVRGLTTTLEYREGTFAHRLPAAPLERGNLRVLFEAADRQIWIGGDSYVHRAGSAGIDTLLENTGWISAFVEDGRGTMWVAGAYGLYQYRAGRFTSATPALPVKESASALAIDSHQNVWVGTQRGLFRLTDDKVAIDPGAQALAQQHVTALLEDRDGNLWAGTDTGGLYRRAADRWTALRAPDGLSDNAVLCLCEDREGSLWIGTRDGLDRLRDTKFTTLTSREGLGHNYTTSVIEAADGALYTFTQGGGVTRLADGKTTVFTTRDGLASDGGNALFASRDGSIWIGTDKGLSRLRDGRITTYDGGGRFAKNFISAINEDEESLLVALSNPPRVHRFRDGQVMDYHVAGRPTPFCTADIYVVSIHRDSRGTMWFATTSGLVRIPPAGPAGNGLQPGVTFTVTCIHDDGQGNLWLGGKTEGLVRFRTEDGLVTRFTSREGLFDEEVSGVIGDGHDGLWLATSRGIVRASLQELNSVADRKTLAVTPVRYGNADGMKTAECSNGFNQPTTCRSRDGRLWFTTPKGLVIFDPANLRRNDLVPPVVIEEVVVDHRSSRPEQVHRLAAGSERVEFRFTALSLLVPERVHFRYRLDGLEAGWVDAGPERVASYTRLPPGRYRFRVIASNDDGVWNDVGAAVVFELEPRFYQTTWFFIGCAIALAALIAIGHLVWTRQLRARERYLARCVAERTRQLQDEVAEHARTGEQLRQAQKMEAIGRLAGGVAHDFNNLLTIINGYTDLLLADTLDDGRRSLLAEIRKAGDRAGSLTSQLLVFSRQQVVAPRVLDLNGVVADAEKMLRRLIGEDVILAVDLFPTLGRIRADAGQVHQVLMNLAVNARDAMPNGGRLTIRTQNAMLDEAAARSRAGASPGPHVVLSMSDTGCGMKPEVMARVFEPFFTTKEVGKGTGLGLATVYGIVQQSGGHVTVASQPGQGTTFEVCFPRILETAPADERRPPSGVRPGGGETVLLVEDEDSVRSLIRHVLESCGYTVLAAADGLAAIRMMAQHGGPVDLLVSDVVMPHMSGRELVEHLRRSHPDLRVLFVSGYTNDEVVRRVVHSADVAFLQKPFTPSALAKAVRQVLDGQSAPLPIAAPVKV